ncbi:MAG: biotin transporter BioY [Pseudomonadota bacterium]
MNEQVLLGRLPYGPPAMRRAGAVAFGVALLVVSAKVNVATVPVPVTMQPLAIMALAMAFGRVLGLSTILAYLALGAAGLPVFAGTPERGIGLVYMFGATGGYLAGFVLATALVGWLAERGWDRSVFTAFPAMVIGLAALYVPGVLWLAYGAPLGLFAGFAGIGIDKAIAAGIMPFLWMDALKLALAAIGFPLIWRVLGNR